MTEFLPLLAQVDLPAPGGLESPWDGGGYTVVMLLFLLLTGGLAAAFYFVKRFGVIRKPGSGKLEILETRPLGGRQYILVGKYGRDTFLLGVCPGRIDYLTRLEQDDAGAGFGNILDATEAERREKSE